ncbi:hypothetical protein [Nocardia terpenica]|uniref:hypothetical protein n=1 Tax=Nocardia terpenica TaxID=455432 RepID=UPI0009EF09FD|nr:hypothetical protein [Nocardia terpenica]
MGRSGRRSPAGRASGWVSAGTTAAIDTGLHLLRDQHGAEIVNRVARRLVAPPYREGGQAHPSAYRTTFRPT